MPDYRPHRDTLTELCDWRKLCLDSPSALADSSRIAYVLADLDEFKRVNDKYSHFVGDRVLREVALALVGKCDDSRICRGPYRLSSSFVVVLTDVVAELAVKFADMLRAAVEQVRIDGYSDLKVTVRLAVFTAAVHDHDSGEMQPYLEDLAGDAHKVVYCHPDDKKRNEVVHVAWQNWGLCQDYSDTSPSVFAKLK